MFNWSRVVERIVVRETDMGVYNLDQWLATEAAVIAMEQGVPLYSKYKEGFLKCSMEEFAAALNDNLTLAIDGGDKQVYTMPRGVLVIEDEGEDNISVHMLSLDKADIDKFLEVATSHLDKTKRNTVFVLVQGMGELYLSPIGTLSSPVVRENYPEDILAGFDFLKKDFMAVNPFGRLAIINGPPGTGKTYLVRGLINELEGSTIVIMPPRMIAEIDGPSLISTFVNHKKKNTKPMILIIEDADVCLAPRIAGDISSISSLLNHTDGILGSMLNLRIIATTNQGHMEFDEALTRAGRLSRHIEVAELSAQKATEIYRRLTKDTEFEYSDKKILANVYADAKIDSDGEIAEFEQDPNFDPDPGRRLRRRMRRVGFGV